jgi:tetratricopeptide (TPR) repeat protein
MPYRVNGIGTNYWGKRNIFLRRGVCESCHAAGDLISYDTTNSLVFLFLPLIPLRKKRVLDDCPHCRRHRVLNLKDWREQREKAFSAARKLFREQPQSDEAAKAIIGAAIAFQDAGLLRRLGPEIHRHQGWNPEILERLGLAYSYFGELEKGEEILRQALALGDRPEAREHLARNLIDQLRPGEALPLLRHILENKEASKAGYLALLIEAYQAQGMHEAALAVLNQCSRAFPDLESSKELKKRRKQSEKLLSSGKALKSAIIGLPTAKVKESGPFSAWMLRLTGPFFLMVLLASFLIGMVLAGQNRNVFVVNGLPEAYQVEIRGESIVLPPLGYSTIKIPEGECNVRVPDNKLNIEPQTCMIQTSPWSRLFSRRTFVLNPDRVAVLVWEQVEYSAQPNLEGEAPVEFLYGDLLYEFKGIDYEFEEFPEEITIDGKRAKRERVGVLQGRKALAAVMIVARERGSQAAFDYVDRMLESGADPELYLSTLSSAVERSPFLDYLRANLDRKPVQVDLHRVYQTTLEQESPEYDLAGEYRARVERNPEEGALYYLLARVLTDPVESEQLLLKAVNAPMASAYGYHGLAYLRLAKGEFADALDLETNALAMEPGKLSFEATMDQILWAVGEYDRLKQRLETRLLETPLSGMLMEGMVRLLAQQEGEEAAKQYINRVCSLLAAKGGGEEIPQVRLLMESVAQYAMGQIPAYCDTLAKNPGHENEFIPVFCVGDYEKAAKLLEDSEDNLATEYLLLYLAASRENKPELAEDCLKRGLEGLSERSREERAIAGYLSGKTPLDVDAALGLAITPDTKRVLLTVLGYRFPDHRKRFYELARRLNYERIFPWHFIEEVTAMP